MRRVLKNGIPPPLEDLASAAKAAGLRYVTDDIPGIHRIRAGSGFRYVDARGRALRDARDLSRIRALAIPAAWTDVWICPFAKGHLQATGRDAKGRKQHRYHPHWREIRDEPKYDRLLSFGRVLPRLRACVRRDLALEGLPRRKVLATVVRLLETTLIRVGNEEYARQNGSYGLTTFRNRHTSHFAMAVSLSWTKVVALSGKVVRAGTFRGRRRISSSTCIVPDGRRRRVPRSDAAVLLAV